MLLSKKKIQIIRDLFSCPDKPRLINILDEKEEITRLSQIRNTMNLTQPLRHKYQTISVESKKSSFPLYNIKTESIDENNKNPLNNTYNVNKYYYPLRKEIIIKNPENIIESGILKSSVKKEGVSSIYENLDINKLEVNQSTPVVLPSGEQPLENEQNNEMTQNVSNNAEISSQQNIVESQNNLETNNEVDKIIPGDITETVKLEEKPLEENNNETPQVEPTTEKKYKVSSGNIVSVPENYSTDDEDEFTAIKTLNEDISSWKKYTDKDGIKLYFKPYPVKDEKSKDVESVIGYCEAILDFPASKVLSKINDFNFRKNVDDQYKKGSLISERMEGNIKYMEMYLYMKMPFIFSDRDFVVRKKCWLDYNGNKDHALFYIHSIENPEYPPNKKLVRGNYANRSGYIKPISDNQCQLNVVTAMDVKMSLGVSTMSKNGAEMQEKWVKNLRKELAK